MDDEAEIWGKVLKKFRHETGWSQSRLGQELDVSANTVCSWESGKQYPQSYLSHALRHLENIYLERIFPKKDFKQKLKRPVARKEEKEPEIVTEQPSSDPKIARRQYLNPVTRKQEYIEQCAIQSLGTGKHGVNEMKMIRGAAVDDLSDAVLQEEKERLINRILFLDKENKWTKKL